MDHTARERLLTVREVILSALRAQRAEEQAEIGMGTLGRMADRILTLFEPMCTERDVARAALREDMLGEHHVQCVRFTMPTARCSLKCETYRRALGEA